MKENFIVNTYVETDPNDRITKTYNTLTATGLSANEDASVVKDFGVAGLDGDFDLRFKLNLTSNDVGAVTMFCFMSNENYNLRTQELNTIQYLGVYIASADIRTWEFGSFGSFTCPAYTMTLGTDYYIRFYGSSTVGTYGTAYLKIYTDAAMTAQVHSASLTLHADAAFRYLFAIGTYNTGVAVAHTVSLGDLEKVDAVTVDDGKDTGKDKRILGIKFVRCAICDRAIRESEAVTQKGQHRCPEDVDILDHANEVG